MKAILVSVDYADLLAITLPYNRHHFSEVMVVTTPEDTGTHKVAQDNHCVVYVTNSFYQGGAVFNKWKALEEGLDRIGRDGWLCIMDADVLWPKQVALHRYLQPGFLYTPRRRMMVDPSPILTQGIPREDLWITYPVHPQEREFAGYSQIFHASDFVLGDPPWHQVDWKHAGGADSFFQAKWPERCKVRPDFHVLHLGPAGVNWCGRASSYLDGRKPDRAEERQSQLTGFLWARRAWSPATGKGKFAHERLE